ncbi:MAG: hypothetical protein L3J74_03025 [Bacteroidales bacterium]|nr:hypothetical protein [Bacteroidales bacterium]
MKYIVLLIIIFGTVFISILSSCHSEYLNLEIKTDGTIAWNRDSSGFAFVARKRLYQDPKGIATFPDGGRVKNVFLDFSLYYYDIKNKNLSHLTGLNNFYNSLSYRWLSIKQVQLSLNDSVLYYKMIAPYDYDIKNLKESSSQILKDIPKIYKINIQTLKKDTVDKKLYNNLFNKKREKLTTKVYKRYLKNLNCADWGIDLKKLHPQSKNTYIDYLVKKEGNTDFRECIFQQKIPNFTKNERNIILNKMQKQKQKLYEKYLSFDEKKDPYRKGKAKRAYEDYLLYINDVKKRLSNY